MIKNFLCIIISIVTISNSFAGEKITYSTHPTGNTSRINMISLSQTTIDYAHQKLIAQEHKELETKGYIEKEEDFANGLMTMDKSKVINDDPNSYQTHMKSKVSLIKLAFPYKPISGLNPEDIIGWAAGGGYIENKGWTGIAEFFKSNDLGVCKYDLDNMELAGGAVYLYEPWIRYDVNNKHTQTHVQGTSKTGYLYSISWYDNTYSRMLECARPTYEPELMSKLIAFAKKIDKDESVI